MLSIYPPGDMYPPPPQTLKTIAPLLFFWCVFFLGGEVVGFCLTLCLLMMPLLLRGWLRWVPSVGTHSTDPDSFYTSMVGNTLSRLSHEEAREYFPLFAVARNSDKEVHEAPMASLPLSVSNPLYFPFSSTPFYTLCLAESSRACPTCEVLFTSTS